MESTTTAADGNILEEEVALEQSLMRGGPELFVEGSL